MLAAASCSDDDANQGWDPGVSFILIENSIAKERYEQAYYSNDNYANVDADIAAVYGRECLAAENTVDDGEAGYCGEIKQYYYIDEIDPIFYTISYGYDREYLDITHPKLYRAWIICRSPVFGPRIDRYAGGTVQRRLKKIITRVASRKLNPILSVPTMPVVTLRSIEDIC